MRSLPIVAVRVASAACDLPNEARLVRSGEFHRITSSGGRFVARGATVELGPDVAAGQRLFVGIAPGGGTRRDLLRVDPTVDGGFGLVATVCPSNCSTAGLFAAGLRRVPHPDRVR